MDTNTVSFVYFNKLPGANQFLETRGTFDSFSYGDAAMTLVTPSMLLEDVEEDEFPELYKTLTNLDPEMLIGFDS